MIAIENVRWKDTEVVRAQEQSAAFWWPTARQLVGKTPEGNGDFICQPGKPQFVAQPASCYTTNSKPRITYMLVGATQRSISDRDDKTSTPLAIGPHWMIMMPFDRKTTGLPVTYSDTGAYIMWAGTPSAHLHIMGRP